MGPWFCETSSLNKLSSFTNEIVVCAFLYNQFFLLKIVENLGNQDNWNIKLKPTKLGQMMMKQLKQNKKKLQNPAGHMSLM